MTTYLFKRIVLGPDGKTPDEYREEKFPTLESMQEYVRKLLKVEFGVTEKSKAHAYDEALKLAYTLNGKTDAECYPILDKIAALLNNPVDGFTDPAGFLVCKDLSVPQEITNGKVILRMKPFV